MMMGDRTKEKSSTEEEDLLAHNIEKAKGLDSIEEVIDDAMTKKLPKGEEETQ